MGSIHRTYFQIIENAQNNLSYKFITDFLISRYMAHLCILYHCARNTQSMVHNPEKKVLSKKVKPFHGFNSNHLLSNHRELMRQKTLATILLTDFLISRYMAHLCILYHYAWRSTHSMVHESVKKYQVKPLHGFNS